MVRRKVDLDVAWAAGFLDGEGCISIHLQKTPTNPRFNLQVSASQASKAPLLKLQELFGGSVSRNGEKYWQWHCYSRQATECIKDIYIHLLVKKNEADIALDFSELPTPFGDEEIIAQRYAYHWALREAKHGKT